ncbi:hypothetical protein B0T22DRAFT_495130 [Podospora appendiculata]|uniref:BTB domain-containing protein n=1 Tax=Podospora appendiculata TaxID=314037 RepID=A0AAE1C6X7_9PEZI|nr:hypothetical protein B0T22DRAFT_495130 [Podospora appendiculata]
MSTTTFPFRAAQDIYAPPANVNHTEKVILDVGGRQFVTTLGSLVQRSGYFSDFFTGSRRDAKQPDGSIFIDADPAVFEHILQYLRRGVFPLAYDQKRGHYFKLYANVLADAQFFRAPKLESWLAAKLYLNCISISTIWSPSYTHDRRSPDAKKTTVWGSDFTSTQMLRDETTKASVFRCRHQLREGHPCSHTMCVPAPTFDEVDSSLWVEVGKSYTFHAGWASDTAKEFQEYWDRLTPPPPFKA